MNRSCRPYEQAISLYASGCPTEGAERAAVQAHFAACSACQTRCAELRTLCVALATETLETASAAEVTRLRARVRAAVEAPSLATAPWSQWLGWKPLFATGGAAAVCFAVALWLLPSAHRMATAKPAAAPAVAKVTAQPLPAALPPPRATVPPPTLWAYQRAALESDQALQALLERHAETVLPPASEPPIGWVGMNRQFNSL